jgi:Sortase domain
MRPRLSQLPPRQPRFRWLDRYRPWGRRWGKLAGALAVVGVFCAGVGVAQITGLPSLSDLVGAHHSGDAMARSIPTRITIASLRVHARIVEVSHADDGSIGTPLADPAGTAGWYGHGPSPGERGSAVIVGHVDTADQPAIFHSLRDLRPGRFIEVRRADRRTATFAVDSVESFPKSSFPADRVFAGTDKPRLVLVTCGGEWVGGDVGYADNVIVFATLT